MAKAKKNISGTDKDIKSAIRRINSKIRSWKKNLPEDIVQTKIANILDDTSFVSYNKALGDFERRNIALTGDDYIPTNKETIEFFKERIQATEDAYTKKLEKDPTATKRKNVLENLDTLQTASEELRETEKELKKGWSLEDEVSLTDYKTEQAKNPYADPKTIKEEVKRINKSRVLQELRNRYAYDFDADFSKVIDKVYEDEIKNADVIDRLREGKWSSELLTEINIRSRAWEIQSDERDDAF